MDSIRWPHKKNRTAQLIVGKVDLNFRAAKTNPAIPINDGRVVAGEIRLVEKL